MDIRCINFIHPIGCHGLFNIADIFIQEDLVKLKIRKLKRKVKNSFFWQISVNDLLDQCDSIPKCNASQCILLSDIMGNDGSYFFRLFCLVICVNE